MGVKQGLGSVLDAASLLSDLPNVVFVIVGAGGEKEALVARAIATEMRNVEFRPPVPQHGLAELLANADISIIPQKTGVKDIVLPSKLGNLLLSRRPVIAAAAMDSELAEVIRVARCGLVVEPGDGKALALAVRQLMDDPTERRAMGERGQVFAHAHLRRAPILDEFLARLIDLSAVRVAARGGA
jgi:colanic acid biosynthesis glycosyl transferase WcaI